MVSLKRDNDCEDSSESVESTQEVGESVYAKIFDDNIQPFTERLKFINENKFGDVWATETERHNKTIKHAKPFVSAVVDQFNVHYERVSKEILRGHTYVNEFQNYILERLSNNIKEVGGMPKNSLHEIKEKLCQSISKIEIKRKEEKETAPKSDIDEVILKSKLTDPVHINHTLLCCRVAYDCKDLEKPEQCLNSFFDKHWLSELVVSYKSPTVPRYVMARCGNVLYVAFRGLENELHTIFAGLFNPNISWKGQTNSIIWKEAEKIPLGYFVREIYRNNRIIFTGHSTGGAIASLVAISLLDKLRSLPPNCIESAIKCITFGIPPFADERLKQYVKSTSTLEECFCHFVKDDDVVPKLFDYNITKLEKFLRDHMMNLVKVATAVTAATAATAATAMMNQPTPGGLANVLISHVVNLVDQPKPGAQKACDSSNAPIPSTSLLTEVKKIFLPFFNIFGVYYFVNPAKERKFIICTSEDAKKKLLLHPEQISGNYKDYLINHKIERYDSDVRQILGNMYPEGLKVCNETKKPDDIFPLVENVQFESFGGEVIAKVCGKNMSFVHEVIFRGLEPLSDKDDDASLENGKSFPVDISKNTESVVEINMGPTHLSCSEVNVRVKMHFQDSKYLEAKDVEACTTPYEISKRQKQLANLSAPKVIELAHLSALLARHISCGDNEEPRSKIYVSVKKFFEGVAAVVPAESLFYTMALSSFSVRQCCQLLSANKKLFEDIFINSCPENCGVTRDYKMFVEFIESVSDNDTANGETNLLKKAEQFIKHFSGRRNSPCKHALRELNLESVLTASVDEHPLTLLKKGRDELSALSKKTSSESCSADNANTNSDMLEKLKDLCKEFQKYSALFSSFMQVSAEVPFTTKYCKSPLQYYVLPFELLLFIPDLREFVRFILRFVLLLSVYVTDYAGKLAFLVRSMKKSSSSSKLFITYSLERELVTECKKRNINYETSLKTILEQWNENFKDEDLEMVEEDYRPMIARWIKWSLMMNQLRESLAEQTAVGVIGLVNSGKSKLVSNMFGIEAISGTVAEKRTTVPYIYNLDDKIDGLDVIDFPGVDDKDKSIPELAKLLLSLTRIVVFVVDYRRAHTEAVAQWLKILEEEKVPVLVCLSFADRLFSEYMKGSKYPENCEVKSALENQLKAIKKLIGQPKNAKPDIRFSVLALDNDSCLNTNEGKQRLHQAGLHDERMVGRWIAEKLRENVDEKLANRVLTFITEKTSSTLYFDEMKH